MNIYHSDSILFIKKQTLFIIRDLWFTPFFVKACFSLSQNIIFTRNKNKTGYFIFWIRKICKFSSNFTINLSVAFVRSIYLIYTLCKIYIYERMPLREGKNKLKMIILKYKKTNSLFIHTLLWILISPK